MESTSCQSSASSATYDEVWSHARGARHLPCVHFSIKEPLLKRPFDVALSMLGLIFSSWVWALVWLAIIFDDGSPALFLQKRVGKNGRVFKSIKFRTMYRRHTFSSNIQHQAQENDKRVTRVGRILRKIALDELPQLMNILCGHMSFVGPRAMLPAEIEPGDDVQELRDIPGYARRILVRPGLTGIAQIYARRDLPRKHKFKYDLLYIRKMNFLTDLRLIFISFAISFKATWEKRTAKLSFLEQKETLPQPSLEPGSAYLDSYEMIPGAVPARRE